MSTITLRQAVELLNKDGDPVEVASLRVHQALQDGKIRSWGLLIKINSAQKADQEIKPDDWQTVRFFNWEESAAETSRDSGGGFVPWLTWHFASRIVLDLDDFNRVFFPQKPFLKAAAFLKEEAALPEQQMNTITLRKAVEMLHKDGDPIEVAVIRIRRAAAAGKIRSRGLAVGFDLSGPPGEYFENEDIITDWVWNNGIVDWEHSTIELPKALQYDENTGCDFMYYCRITLDRDAFDHAFFPDKAKPVVEKGPPVKQKPPISIREVKNWLDQKYDGKPRPRVHDLRAAAKTYDPRITRAVLERAAAEKWPEPRRRGRPSSENNVPGKVPG